MNGPQIKKRTYDHRLRNYVRETNDVEIALNLGVPKSTISGWLATPIEDVVSHAVFDLNDLQVRQRVLRLERRLRKLTAILVLLLTLVQVFRLRVDYQRLPNGEYKKRLIRAIKRAQTELPLRAVLRILRLSSTRFHSWIRAEEQGCDLDDQSTCPKTQPTQLTADEIQIMRNMVTSEQYRHVSAGRLAILAQRLGQVFASPATWHRYIRSRDWRRPRKRVHPSKPTVGLRCTTPNETWHIDTTVFRLLDGSKGYLQAIIDNYSRRILAWRLGPKLEPAATASLLVKAYESKKWASTDPQSVMIDAGVENLNEAVMKLVSDGILKLILAQTDLSFSNSMIEAFWRVMKHQWLYLNQLDNLATLRRLVDFYVNQHNRVLPHSAFEGQTPDEMYCQTGAGIPTELETARRRARVLRIETNRGWNCESCQDIAMVANA